MSDQREHDAEFLEAVAWAERTDISHAKTLMKRLRFYERTHPWSSMVAPSPEKPAERKGCRCVDEHVCEKYQGERAPEPQEKPLDQGRGK